jgi:hypothetical protein
VTLPATVPQTTVPAQAKPKFEFTTPLDDEYLNALIYGDFGVGKSTLAASASEVAAMQDVLYLSAEAGEKVLKPFADNGHLTVVRVGTYATLARVYEWMVLHCRYRDAGEMDKLAQLESIITGVVPEKPKQFHTVVLDSLTEMQVYLMYQLLGIEIGRSRLDLPPDSPEFKEWGQSSEMIKLLVRSFRDLHLNVIIVCSMQEVEDEKKRLNKRLLLPGKLAVSIQGFLDVVGFLEKAKTDAGFAWRLHLTSGQTFHAKNRFGPLAPPHIDIAQGDTTGMAKLFALNNSATTKTTPKEPQTNGDTSTASPSTGSSPAGSPASSTRPAGTGGTRAPIRVGGSGPVRPAGH